MPMNPPGLIKLAGKGKSGLYWIVVGTHVMGELSIGFFNA